MARTCILMRPSMARGSRKWVWIGGEGEESAGEENEAHAERKDS